MIDNNLKRISAIQGKKKMDFNFRGKIKQDENGNENPR